MCYLSIFDGTFHNAIIAIMYHLNIFTICQAVLVSSNYCQSAPTQKMSLFRIIHIFLSFPASCIANKIYLDFDSSALSCVVNSSSISSSSQLSCHC
mmetsp:Transcript_1925/g.3243  ORF Transcript_1925/g.3243 Transcript_1925/m.3243 type:complete len:96 (+) Transcript_1925:49-336(+)